ncbi:class I SAM-dependent methyltransferase [Trinickia violacea]|uniref:Class I SAM-dependent methyltransferase n=1 Tax=Trinickia violacea TaxID=2571746 RepID=A0A4P8IQY3_9BURK|nr:class I SAM-dependent methyltransferase [Trinickia violacea]QCP50766.1 class I SAM-dependent methyltransferase [Trinickia violacea]
MQERFQPIAVTSPCQHPWLFKLRCLVDVQLGSIVKHLRPALSRLRGRVLDVGAGESPWRDWLPRGTTYQGIDIGNAADFGMSGGRNDIKYYDGTRIPFDDAEFDSAICIEVLEHAQNPELLLREIARVLKEQGVLLLTVPWSARRHHIPYDYHRFTRERLQILIGEVGFGDIQIIERGSDIGVIANKLTVLTARLIKPASARSLLWTAPLAVVCALLAVMFLIAAHCADPLGKGSVEDPLGYFVSAVRRRHGPA